MRLQKIRIGIILGIISIFVLSACGREVQEENPVSTVYEFGGTAITYGEYYIYAKTVEEDYQKAYGSGVWGLELATDDGSSTVSELTIQDIISDINRVKVLNAHAEELSIALTDSENAEAENRATGFYNGLTEQDIRETEITPELVRQVISENMIAKKVYDQVLSDYDFEISDEEARMTTFYDMVFECYSVEKDGSVTEYTPEQKEAQLERANEALSSLAEEEGVTFEKLIDKYKTPYSSSYTMSKTQMIEEYGEGVANMILALSDGEVSVVIETRYGYHLFKMLDVNDEELTKENKAQIVTAKQKEYFNGVYAEWLEKYDSHFDAVKNVNMELAGRFPFSESGDGE